MSVINQTTWRNNGNGGYVRIRQMQVGLGSELVRQTLTPNRQFLPWTLDDHVLFEFTRNQGDRSRRHFRTASIDHEILTEVAPYVMDRIEEELGKIERATRNGRPAATNNQMLRKKAVSLHLDGRDIAHTLDDIELLNNQFFRYKDEYLRVCTEAEADKCVEEAVLANLWRFRGDALNHYSHGGGSAFVTSINRIVEKCGADANPVLLAVLKDRDGFVNNMISCHGRGYYLAADQDECEIRVDGNCFYLYHQ